MLGFLLPLVGSDCFIRNSGTDKTAILVTKLTFSPIPIYLQRFMFFGGGFVCVLVPQCR